MGITFFSVVKNELKHTMYLSKYAGMCEYLLIYTRLFVVLKPLHTCHAKEENVLQICGQTCTYGLKNWGSNKTKCSGVQYKVLLCTKSSSPFKKNAPNDLFYVKKISQEKRLLEAGKIDCWYILT